MKFKHFILGLSTVISLISCEGTDFKNDFVQPVFRGEGINSDGTVNVPTELNIGETHTIKAISFFNDIGIAEKVTFESLDTNILTVDANGVITAVGDGSTTIRVIVANSNSKTSTATPNYSAVSKSILVKLFIEKLSITNPINVLKLGQTHQLKYTYKNTKGVLDTSTSLDWKSSDVTIAIVSDKGLLTALKDGKVTIILSTKSTPTVSSTPFNLTIESFPEELSITNPKSLLASAKTYQLNYTYKNSKGMADTTTTLTWMSSNSSVATVSDKGLITTIKDGMTTITLSTPGNTISRSFILKVSNLISVFRFDKMILSPIKIGKMDNLTATFFDKTGTANSNNPFTWTSSNTSVARVDINGVVTAISVGSTNITVSVNEDGNKISATASVTTVSNTLVINNNLNTSLTVGKTHQYSTTFEGSTTINWRSSNVGIATVSSTGLVTIVGVGTTTITASTTERGMLLEASDSVSGINNTLSINNEISSIKKGETHQYTTTFLGSTPITWSSSDTSVASISASGLVTAKSSGSVTITATTIEGGNTLTETDTFTISSNSRSGTLSGTYQLRGSVTLKNSVLTTSSDFNVSGLPGGYIYMSNNPNSISGALEVGVISPTSGAGTYTVPGNIGLDDYKYVIIWCKPFGIFVGNAELK